MSPAGPSPGVPDDSWCKNRLQEYTQRASMPLPVYQTVIEVNAHPHQFRSRVWVDGTCFTSPNTCLTRKAAEQAAAKLAWVTIREKVKNECLSRIREDTMFCKLIVHEYAMKMNLKAPTYVTNVSKMKLPMYVSTLTLDGVEYMGDAGKNKKDAEQFAARAAILSILGSESGTTMSEMVKSKLTFYDVFKNVPATPGDQGGATPAGANLLEVRSPDKELVSTGGCGTNSFSTSHVLPNERPEVALGGGCVASSSAAPHFLPSDRNIVLSGGCVNCSTVAVAQSSSVTCPNQIATSESPFEQLPSSQATHQPLHVLEHDKPRTSSSIVAPQIVCIPPAPEKLPMCSSSEKKRKRKKKKANAKSQHQPMSDAVQDSTISAGVNLLEDRGSHKEAVLSGGCVIGSFATPQVSMVTCPSQVAPSGTTFDLLPNPQAAQQPLHELERNNRQTSSSLIAPTIVFAPGPEKPHICPTSCRN